MFNSHKIKEIFSIIKSQFADALQIMTDKGILFYADELKVGTIVFSAPGILAIDGSYIYTDLNTQLPMQLTVTDGVVTAINAIDPVKVADVVVKPLEQTGDATSNAISNDGQPGNQEHPIVPAGFAEEEPASNQDPDSRPEEEDKESKDSKRISELEKKLEQLEASFNELSGKVTALIALDEDKQDPDSFKKNNYSDVKGRPDYDRYNRMAESYRKK